MKTTTVADRCFAVQDSMHARLVGALIGLLVLAHVGRALAQDVVASVIGVRGAVFVAADGGRMQPLARNAQLKLGDTIVSTGGKAKIALADGTIVSIGEYTEVRVAAYAREGGETQTRLRMVAGVLRLLVAKITPAGRFEVETETAIAAVRGTDWVVDANADVTSVAVLAGVVAVSGRDAQAQAIVVLEAGDGTDVRRASAPTPPKRWGAERLARTVERATFD